MHDELETKQDEPGSTGIVSRWLKEIHLAQKQEKDWRDDAERALKVYKGKNSKKETFNILWANVETKRPSLYNSLPEPDIRRRHDDKDPVAKAVSELLEKSISYVIDCADMDGVNKAAVNDMLLAGRGVTMVNYEPEIIDGQIARQKIAFEQIQYDDFIRGPGKVWKDVPWFGIKYKLTKEQVREKFPDFVDKVTYDTHEGDDKDKTDGTVFKRTQVFRIFDKDERKVIWIAPSYVESPLDIQDDPLELKDFFPIPKPLYACESPDSLEPICEFSQYYVLAKELEDITTRINKIVNAIRARGIYDSTLAEMEKLFDSDDNEFIPSEDTSRLIESKGLSNAIYMLPVRDLAEVLQILKVQRRDLIQEIYEITGISDIMRGSTNPHETKGAQEIKANFGVGRLSDQQKSVQYYIRDVIRIVAEIIAENFTRESLSQMTGMNFPTEADKQLAQYQMQVAQMTQQEPDPSLQQTLMTPSWEDIEEVLQNDFLREYRVDIETDSTIQLDEQRDKKNMGDLMKAIADFTGAMAPAMQAGFLNPDAPAKIIKSFVRKFKLGRELEDILDEPPPPKGPSPEEMKMQMEQQKAQMEGQMKQQEHQMEMQAEQQRLQAEVQKMQMELQMEREKMNLEREKMAMEMQNERMKMAMERDSLSLKNEYESASHKRKMEEMNDRH